MRETCNCPPLSGPDPRLLFQLSMKHFLEESEKGGLSVTVKKPKMDSLLKQTQKQIPLTSIVEKKTWQLSENLWDTGCMKKQSILSNFVWFIFKMMFEMGEKWRFKVKSCILWFLSKFYQVFFMKYLCILRYFTIRKCHRINFYYVFYPASDLLALP